MCACRILLWKPTTYRLIFLLSLILLRCFKLNSAEFSWMFPSEVKAKKEMSQNLWLIMVCSYHFQNFKSLSKRMQYFLCLLFINFLRYSNTLFPKAYYYWRWPHLTFKKCLYTTMILFCLLLTTLIDFTMYIGHIKLTQAHANNKS